MKLQKIIGPSIVIALLVLLYIPTGHWLFDSWLSNPYYTHGFLIPAVSGFIIWRKRRELILAKPLNIGVVVLAVGALIYIMGSLQDIRSLTAFSFLIVLSGLILYFYGTKAMRSLAFPLAFLVFMIPPPFLDKWGFYLQFTSLHSSATLLDWMGFSVTTNGTEIALSGATFTIGIPCSGMNTLIALLALSAVFTYILSGPIYKRAILFVIAFPIAILANILRIVSIILVAHYYNAKFATGFFHDISSPLFFLIAFLFIVLLSRLLGCKVVIGTPEK